MCLGLSFPFWTLHVSDMLFNIHNYMSPSHSKAIAGGGEMCWQFCVVAAACHYDLITASISLNNVDIVTSLFPPTQTQTVTRERWWQSSSGQHWCKQIFLTQQNASSFRYQIDIKRRWEMKETKYVQRSMRKIRLEDPFLSLIIVSGAVYFISPLANTQNNETMMSSCQSLGF